MSNQIKILFTRIADTQKQINELQEQREELEQEIGKEFNDMGITTLTIDGICTITMTEKESFKQNYSPLHLETMKRIRKEASTRIKDMERQLAHDFEIEGVKPETVVSYRLTLHDVDKEQE